MKKLLNTIFINDPDRYLSLDGENLVIKENGDEIGRVPFHNIGRIISCGHSGASPALMGKCVKDGIELVFLNRDGKFLARVEGQVSKNVLLRRQQYRFADDAKKSLDISKNIICAKIFNSRWVLERTVREHDVRIDTEKFKKKSEILKENIKKAKNCMDIDCLRGIEGETASVYFSVFDDMILQQEDDFYFKTRNKRPPTDNVNALLSFTYSIATGICASALEAVGLDPYVGFMHTDRPGRRSLALDLLEEFRAVLCDRFVLALINTKILQNDDFIKSENGAVKLSDGGRRKFFSAWQKKQKKELTHPFIEEKIEWGMAPCVQALLLSRYIRGDLDCYPPFMWK